MSLIIESTYENGAFRPLAPLRFIKEGQCVFHTVEDEAEMKKRQEEVIRKMEEEGLILHFPAPEEPSPLDFKPVKIIGKPLSETVIEERR